MQGSRRHRLAGVLAFALGAVGLSGAVAAPAAADEARPSTAVVLGDSFVSGEGARSYLPVTDVDGVSRSFPGWLAPNSNAYFCHRSANASIFQADLPGIEARFNLACSGGQPRDLADPETARPNGRRVAAQLAQLREVAKTHDIDLVLLGVGSNNSSFTFGQVASECANRFVADGFTGWWEFWVLLAGPVEQEPCTDDDLATPAKFAAATAETTAAVRQVLTTLDEIDPDGQHRVVLQDYTNPLPPDLDPKFFEEDGRQDDRDKFRALVRERYAAGCPVHLASLPPAHRFSQGLGRLVQDVHDQLATEFPQDDLVYLNVQRAFDGARLCEHADSPQGTLATPVRLQEGPTGVFEQSLDGKDKIDIKLMANTCTEFFQTCQESWHPNAAGQGVLGRCLSGAATTGARAVRCVRSPDGTISVVDDRQNLARSATASASSTFSGYSAARVNDGDRSTALGAASSWANAAGTYPPDNPQWVQLDLGGTRTVRTVEVYTTASYPVRDVDVQVLDASGWTTVAQARGNTAAHLTLGFPAVSTTAVRVVGRQGPDHQPGFVRFNEIEVY